MKKSAAESAADEFARVCMVDPAKRADFLEGVDWAIKMFERILRRDGYEDLLGYPTKLVERMTLDDVREIFNDWTKK